MNDIYHEGELTVQAKAGGSEIAVHSSQAIKSEISSRAVKFLRKQPFIIAASIDSQQRVWASILTGEPGFLSIPDDKTLIIKALPDERDPLAQNLREMGEIGLTAIEFAKRRRMRLNGKVMIQSDQLVVQTEQVYFSCPKFIQERPITTTNQKHHARQVKTSTTLSPEQATWIRNADTFFIASAHPTRGADASHRGGNAGFIDVKDGQLIYPDYSGNMMFNTLGNIESNPNSGLLFLDFEQGRTLQLTGKSKIVWDEEQVAQYVGAERLVTFEPEEIIETADTLPYTWEFVSYSRFNPSESD